MDFDRTPDLVSSALEARVDGISKKVFTRRTNSGVKNGRTSPIGELVSANREILSSLGELVTVLLVR